MTVRVVTDPTDTDFDGTAAVTFTVDDAAAAAEIQGYQQMSSADGKRAAVAQAAEATMDVTFYHCVEGNFWNASEAAAGGTTDDTGCSLCTDIAEGDVEVRSASALHGCVRHFVLQRAGSVRNTRGASEGRRA